MIPIIILSSYTITQKKKKKQINYTFQGSNLHPKSEKELHEALSSCEWQGNLKQRMLMYSQYHLPHAANWLSFLHPGHVVSIHNKVRKEQTINQGNQPHWSHCNLIRLELASLNHSMHSSAVPDGWASCQAIALSSCK